jgi:hypothetical protein
VPVITFDSTVPVELQLTDYSCSVGATFWCLRSLGISLTHQDLQDVMVPALVSPALGLLDGSGATIASLLRTRYALSATNMSPVSFDQVGARAGRRRSVTDSSGAQGWIANEYLTRRMDDSELRIPVAPAPTSARNQAPPRPLSGSSRKAQSDRC